MTEPENVLKFPATKDDDEKQFSRVKEEAERLANQSESERAFFIPKRAESIGVSAAVLKAAVTAILHDRAKRTAAEHLEQERERQRQEMQRVAEERKERQLAKERARERQQAKKEQEREQKRLAKETEREQRRTEKEAKRKENDKQKTFAGMAKQPVARHENELKRLADRLGDDVAVLREEFEEYLGVGGGGEASTEKTEPWPEPVNTATLLQELGDKVSRYVVLQEHQLTATVLWVPHTWLYDQDVPAHSPNLALTSPEPDSGKSTHVAVVGCATPRFSLNIEMTGPSLYRYVDAVKPTLGIDEADDLFVRKSDLKHIINAGWTRGAKIPRQVNIEGVWTTVNFDPFTPKMIALLGRNLPPATRSRCIELRMLPKRPDEHVEPFNQLDDAEFAILRRKFARWAADNAAALKEAKPTMPTGLNNRAAANWKLLLAIAELAGGSWPQRAREAAERLSHTGRRPSDGVQLLAAFKAMIAERRKMEIPSEDVVAYLRSDPTSIWADYNHGGPITQRQVAHLLDAFDIHPVVVHPSKRSNQSPRGYKLEQFNDSFSRYLPADPHIRTSDKPKIKTKKRK